MLNKRVKLPKLIKGSIPKDYKMVMQGLNATYIYLFSKAGFLCVALACSGLAL